MRITREQVLHVADLARLDMADDAVQMFADQIGKILDYVETLDRVDTAGVEPTFHAIALTNALREDVPRTHLDRDAVLANAPQQEDGNFIVPRVIG